MAHGNSGQAGKGEQVPRRVVVELQEMGEERPV